ncbi:hypothetical protein F5051DRAFT_447349 [Lentinula edodes]|nr:hypothetical protein F5051DRAFT_447349 [Lentinula edodes]
MSFDCPRRSASRTPSPPLPTLTSLGEVASAGSGSDGEVEQDQLTFTIESPSCPQLQLFKTVFNTGKPLSAYCEDDPLRSLLAAVASPCTNCRKTPTKCQARSFGIATLLIGVVKTWHIVAGFWSSMGLPRTVLLGGFLWIVEHEVEADQQELQKFLALQQDEASVAARHKHAHSPLPVAGPSTKKVWSEVPKKHSHRKSSGVEVALDPPRRVRLVVPPSQSSATANELASFLCERERKESNGHSNQPI